MRLLVSLVLRLVAAVALCLACAVGWVLVDAHRSIGAETTATADRVARDLNNLYWREIMWRGSLTRSTLLPKPEWRTLDVLRVVAPGVCVTFAPGDEPLRRLCGQEEGVGRTPPDWFAGLYRGVFGPNEPVSRPLTVRDRSVGAVTADADPAAALRQAWAQLSIVAGVAAAMAAATALLAGLMIGHALLPSTMAPAGSSAWPIISAASSAIAAAIAAATPAMIDNCAQACFSAAAGSGSAVTLPTDLSRIVSGRETGWFGPKTPR